MNEFELIKKYFFKRSNQNIGGAFSKDIALSMGDDAAVFSVPDSMQFVSSIDTLVCGVHFPEDTKPYDIAYKSLAVSLSDLAAMGARPHSFTLSVTLPKLDECWLEQFSQGLFELANYFGIQLVGGDTSKGPLSITIQVNGVCKKNNFLVRSGAKAGDHIFVTGALGIAALGLSVWQGQGDQDRYPRSVQRFLRPEPRVDFAQKLYGVGASACIDISDGLLADLSHMLKASHLGAKIYLDSLYCDTELGHDAGSNVELTRNRMLSMGDDYELCFTVPVSRLEQLQELTQDFDFPLSEIGEMTEDEQLKVYDVKEQLIELASLGFQHF